MRATAINPRQISQARLRAGLTQNDVAHTLRERGHKADGVSVSRWERGQNAPRSNIIPDLAAVLGVRIEELYERSESGDDDDEETDEPVRRLRQISSELAQLNRDDLAAELLSIAGLVARDTRRSKKEGAPR